MGQSACMHLFMATDVGGDGAFCWTCLNVLQDMGETESFFVQPSLFDSAPVTEGPLSQV